MEIFALPGMSLPSYADMDAIISEMTCLQEAIYQFAWYKYAILNPNQYGELELDPLKISLFG